MTIVVALIKAWTHHHHHETCYHTTWDWGLGHICSFITTAAEKSSHCLCVATSTMNDPTNCICLEVCLYRVQVAVGVLCQTAALWFRQTRTVLSVFWWILLQERGNLVFLEWAESPGWLVWISCLDLSTVVAVTSHPLESSKDWNIHAFWQFRAYLRQSTGLYLAASGCIVLIFLQPLSAFL